MGGVKTVLLYNGRSRGRSLLPLVLPLVSPSPASAGRIWHLNAMSAETAPVLVPLEQSPDPPRDRAGFDGLLLTAISYGALLMLCCQLCQSLYLRPKRGPKFYCMIAYALVVFVLATVSVSGRFVTAEQQFIDQRFFAYGPTEWFWRNSDNWQSVMTFACSIAIPWFADLLMLYRIYELWNRRLYVVAPPALLYLTGIALSIPFILAMSKPNDPSWVALLPRYSISYVAIMSAFNIVVSITLFVRLYTLRDKVVQVAGKVPAIMYNSPATLFVETGAFYSIWITTYLVLICRNSYARDVFLQAAVYVLVRDQSLPESALSHLAVVVDIPDTHPRANGQPHGVEQGHRMRFLAGCLGLANLLGSEPHHPNAEDTVKN
ncbi:hypothetical protein NMY22_g12184 [Coprinellus aureogranulatus]|nr:hypothetical protein NMY22_g12184 [Coprinellus aureogranulatus]